MTDKPTYEELAKRVINLEAKQNRVLIPDWAKYVVSLITILATIFIGIGKTTERIDNVEENYASKIYVNTADTEVAKAISDVVSASEQLRIRVETNKENITEVKATVEKNTTKIDGNKDLIYSKVK